MAPSVLPDDRLTPNANLAATLTHRLCVVPTIYVDCVSCSSYKPVGLLCSVISGFEPTHHDRFYSPSLGPPNLTLLKSSSKKDCLSRCSYSLASLLQLQLFVTSLSPIASLAHSQSHMCILKWRLKDWLAQRSCGEKKTLFISGKQFSSYDPNSSFYFIY